MPLDLNLLRFKDDLSIRKKSNSKAKIYDPIRKKDIVLQPEELVRQLVIQFLLKELHISLKKIQVEKQLTIHGMNKRYDIIVYDKDYLPILLIECKSYKLNLVQSNFNQIAAYNLALKVPYLMITNGLQSYVCKMDYDKKDFSFLDEFPILN